MHRPQPLLYIFLSLRASEQEVKARAKKRFKEKYPIKLKFFYSLFLTILLYFFILYLTLANGIAFSLVAIMLIISNVNRKRSQVCARAAMK
jgi:hypothetical protein